MTSQALPIYVRTEPAPRLSLPGRLFAASIALACLAVFIVAAKLTPDPHGMGTHQQLGLAPCGMVELFGIPCPTCGYTTSFSLFVRGRWLASAWNQPGGFVTALLSGVLMWGAAYVAVTGSQLYRLLSRWVTPTTIFGFGLVVLLAWGWKIVLTRMSGVPLY